jgi:hypothetical protein
VADQHDRNEHYHITRQDSFLYTIATTSIIRQQVDLGDQGADSKVQVTVRLKVPPPNAVSTREKLQEKEFVAKPSRD